MTEITQSEQPKILNTMIESLAQASGGCSQLVHARQDPRFINMRWMVDRARDACIQVAQFEAGKITMRKPS